MDTIDDSQRKAATVAGGALLAILIVIVANYAVNFRFIVPGDAAETAKNILAHQTLIRINVACNLVYVVTLVALLTSLYVMLKPVGRNLALIAAFCRLIFALVWVFTAINMLSALRLLGGTAYLSVFDADKLQSMARLHIAASYDAYYVGLPFWGFASMLCSYLLFKSGYIPRLLAGYGLIASGWCVICAFAFLVFPDFDRTVGAYWYDMPLVIFELALGIWLLVKGLKPPRRAA
jgi:hypothetical protein